MPACQIGPKAQRNKADTDCVKNQQVIQGSFHYQPKHCSTIREISQNVRHIWIVWSGNLTTPRPSDIPFQDSKVARICYQLFKCWIHKSLYTSTTITAFENQISTRIFQGPGIKPIVYRMANWRRRAFWRSTSWYAVVGCTVTSWVKW